jgi:hypothetical protein
MDAVREEGSFAEEAVTAQPPDDAGPAAAPAVLDVEAVLGDVHVHARAPLGHGRGQEVEALVGEREARVGPDHAAGEGGGAAREERPVLRDPGISPAEAVATGRLVAQHRSQPDLLDRPPQRRERPFDGGRRGMVVEEHGRPRARGLDRAHEPGEVYRLLVQRPVQSPPDLLQDLDEAARRLSRSRHAPGEGAVEVGVGIDEPRHHERTVEVEHLLAGRGAELRAAGDDDATLDPQVAPFDVLRIEGP